MQHVIAGLFFVALLAAATSGLDAAYLLVVLLLVMPLVYLWGKNAH